MAHEKYNLGFVFVIFLLLFTVYYGDCKGPQKKLKCDIETCKPKMNAAPTNYCKEEESEAQKCLAGLSEKCPDDPRIIYFVEKFKLIQIAMCGRDGTGPDFENNLDCWPETEECLNQLVTPENMLKGKVCAIKKVNNDQCKVKKEVKFHCRTMHAIFLELAFQESQCRGAFFIVSTITFAFSLVVGFGIN